MLFPYLYLILLVLNETASLMFVSSVLVTYGRFNIRKKIKACRRVGNGLVADHLATMASVLDARHAGIEQRQTLNVLFSASVACGERAPPAVRALSVRVCFLAP